MKQITMKHNMAKKHRRSERKSVTRQKTDLDAEVLDALLEVQDETFPILLVPPLPSPEPDVQHRSIDNAFRRVVANSPPPIPPSQAVTINLNNSYEWPALGEPTPPPPLHPDPSVVSAAMNHGTSRLDTVRLLVLGSPGRGKTTTISSLRRREFVEKRSSTRCVELNVCYVVPGRPTIDEQLQNTLRHRDTFKTRFRNFLRELRKRPITSPGIRRHSSDPNIVQMIGLDNISNVTQDDLHDSVMEKASASDEFPVQSIPEACVTLRVWDFGGQREYEAAHELFISPRSILLFVFNLSNFIDNETKEKEVAELSRWLLNAFALTTDYQGDCIPPILILGTHRDSCESSMEVAQHFSELRMMLLKKLPPRLCDEWELDSVKMLAIENRTAVKDIKHSGLESLENQLKLYALKVIEESEQIPLRWLAFLEELKSENKKTGSLFIEQDTIEEMMKGFRFPLYGVNQNEELENFLLYFRDLGELVLFARERQIAEDDESGSIFSESALSVSQSQYCVFPEPEKILEALAVIIAPPSIRCEGLRCGSHIDLVTRGHLDMDILKNKWGGMAGLQGEHEREVLVNLLIAMDIFVKLEDKCLAVPALIKSGWEDWSWLKGGGRKRELSAITKLEDVVPIGLIGTLIARLHRTIGQKGTKIHCVRSNAVLLSIPTQKPGKQLKQLFAGFDFSNRSLHWTVRADKYDFELLALSLRAFDEHVRYRLGEKRKQLKYEHFFSVKCPKGCSETDETVLLKMPPLEQIVECVYRERRPEKWAGLFAGHKSALSRISDICEEDVCQNPECLQIMSLKDGLSVSIVSEAPGPGSRQEDKYKVFLSHAGEDKKLAVMLKRELDRRGLHTFVDRLGLQGSRVTASRRMKSVLRTACIGVFLLSPEFFGKLWTMLELREFLKRKLGGGDDGQHVLLFPIFHRLTYREASDNELYKKKHIGLFGSLGFFDPRRQQQCSTTDALGAFQEVCKYSGLEQKNWDMHLMAIWRNPWVYLWTLLVRVVKYIFGVERDSLWLFGVTNQQFVETAADRIHQAYQKPIDCDGSGQSDEEDACLH